MDEIYKRKEFTVEEYEQEIEESGGNIIKLKTYR